VFRIDQLAFDEKYAEELTQRLESNHGIERWAFPQTIMEFAGPTAEFERLVIAGQLHHNGHPIMTWQIGHTNVKTDANLNKRPVKPQRGDARSIDGVVAAIMALGRSDAEGKTVYEQSGRGFQTFE
jgi:phage terminase large subunit-like protein